jgi:hypothetical protein
LIGHNGKNVIRAGDQAGLIAQPGQDLHPVVLIGLGGDDTLHGGSGKDNFFGGSGNDEMFGKDGNDKFYFGLNSIEGPMPSYFENSSSDSETDAFNSPTFDEYFFDNPQELTGGQDTAFGGEGVDEVVVISPLWNQPSFQRTSNSSITLSSELDTLKVDSTTEFIKNYTYDGESPYVSSTTKILPFVWSTIKESYVFAESRYDWREIDVITGYTPSVPIYKTVKKKQVLQGYTTPQPIWGKQSVQDVYVPPDIREREYADEKAIFEKIHGH